MNPTTSSSCLNNGLKSPEYSHQPCSGEDNLSLMSETSLDRNHTPTKYYVDRGVNTEDTLRLVPFEVDHWASKCIRLADEFQTSRSFEDAQSNISELSESLKEYLKLWKSDGALRVDILLYVIIANIIEGLETNGHIFTSEVPSVSKILTNCLLTSGQLGRYGFQSFKQSVKALRFLQHYYRKRELSPEKLPIILWQSVKKISLKGTTPYPTLYPSEFHFHLESCPDSESCKTIRLDFGNSSALTSSTPIILKHCTSTLEIIEALKSLANQNLDFGCDHVQPRLELGGGRGSGGSTPLSFDQIHAKHLDIALQEMVICDVDTTSHSSGNKLLISDIVQTQPQYSKAFQQFQSKLNYGGSIVIRFKSRYFNGEGKYSKDASFYTLGTKQYCEKHCQILLVDVNDEMIDDDDQLHWLVADLNGRRVQEAEKIGDIHSFKWDLKFGSCHAGCWTCPEVHFVNKLVLLPFLEDCSISFEDHSCLHEFKGKCSDCKLTDGLNSSSSSISVDQVFASGSVQINVKLDLKCLGLTTELLSTESSTRDDNDVGIINPGKFALFKFALSIPLELRGLLVELQKESKLRSTKNNGKMVEKMVGLFNDEAFNDIVKLWETHKDYYYAVWYTS